VLTTKEPKSTKFKSINIRLVSLVRFMVNKMNPMSTPINCLKLGE